MNIVISPAERGRYHAHLAGRLLCTSLTPLFSAARVLKAEGVLPQEPLIMTHEGSDMVCLTSTVGEAASFTVDEGRNSGPTLRPYRPSPFARPE
ncbi:hypothetical protein Mpop_2388 [Methylorubrum populi BJ001]|jgi:hypothetical protein|uniref:Uncharacterized protein n=1 Tax=Methylorubrum populi (strain ATCC BAA-705 / NCIMB 13946 / BJ001) TaxID=441620 RepID=B1Z9E4_METPB|nr:hypothetical protein [Methylorubrum populi]ACB80550.1 hypothetical protein Mpop_2388 [Methylorubrum populi BJ001]